MATLHSSRSIEGSRLIIAAVGILALLIIPGPVVANSVGFSTGDSLVFSYERYTTYATPNGNQTFISMNQFTVFINSINTTAKGGGVVGYSETIQEFNNSAVTNSTAYENFTTIFDPYDNSSYLGNIGFYPFTYTDLTAGSVGNLGINVTTSGIPVGNGSESVSSIQRVNVTVARGPGLIYVNLTTIGYTGEHPSQWAMQFNSTTGVLEYGKTTVNLISDIEGIYTYHLLSYIHQSPPAYQAYIPYIIVGAIVVVIVVSALAGRKSERQKKTAHFREKLS